MVSRIHLPCRVHMWATFLAWAIFLVTPLGYLPAFAQDDEPVHETYRCADYLKSIRLPPQRFQIQSDVTHHLKLAYGTELLIPANTFGLDQGPYYSQAPLVLGMIDLEVTEVVDPMAYALYNIPVTWSESGIEKPVAAHGAVRIKARWEGRKLRLRTSNSILVLFANHPAADALNFNGSHDDSEHMFWDQKYYARADDYAGKLTPEGPVLDNSYPFLGNIGKASPVTHQFEDADFTVEDIVIGKTPDPQAPIDWTKVRLWVNGKGYAKQLDGIHGGLASPIAAVQILAAVQWDVAHWDTLKPIPLSVPQHYDFEPIGSAVPEEHTIASNTLRAIENKQHLEEMLRMMPVTKVKEFLDHAVCVDEMGWSVTGRVVDVGNAKPITVDLGLQYNDAKVFLVMPQDTIVLAGQRQDNGTFRFPAVPDGHLARIVAMAYSTNLGPMLGMELIETAGGPHKIAMKSLPWSSLQALQAKAAGQK